MCNSPKMTLFLGGKLPKIYKNLASHFSYTFLVPFKSISSLGNRLKIFVLFSMPVIK